MTALAFAPDGDVLAIGTAAGAVRLAHLPANPGGEPPEPPLRLRGHVGAVRELTFNPNGRRLATAGEDKTVTVWDLDRLDGELERLGMGW